MSTPLRLPNRPKEGIPVVIDGPLAAASFAWRLRPPADARVVVVKCTLRLVPEGAAVPLDDQDPPTGDTPHDDDGASSPRYPSDFVPFKPRADVLLVGHAYPQGTAGFASVQLAFGTLHRSLAALGDRRWDGGVPSAPAQFPRMPLRYERAFGGPAHEANPLGAGIDGARLPNLEQPDRLIRQKGDRPAPACFAPVPASFRARAGRLGSYDAAWLRERWPWFPRDFDWAYFNSAPPEQQIPYPRGDEPFSLSGVSQASPVLRGRLPGLLPRAFTVPPGAHETTPLREIPLQLDTVWFDGDALRVVLIWRGVVEVSAEHAPEIAALFVCDDRVGTTADPAAASRRLAEKLVELHGPPPAATEAPAAAAAAPPPVAAPPGKGREEVAALLASGAALADVDLARADLSGLDLSGKKLAGAMLSGAKIEGTRFDGADLAGAVLAGVTGRGASFRDATLRGANLAGAKLPGADLSGAVLEDASLPDADLTGAVLRGAKLARGNLADARLAGAVLDGAGAEAADFSGAVLGGASFKGAFLEDAQVYGCEAEGASFDDASMKRFRADGARMARCSFARAKAADASFEAADLRGAKLLDAELDGGVFNQADLGGAVLTRASAKGARFRHAKLANASGLRANLMEASFESADLTGADLRGANLYAVETRDAKLDGARLDQALVAGSKLA